jgi:predicted ATPase
MKEPNQWYVITGAPCSGKTSVIHELEKRGYHIVTETARAHIEKQLAKGLTLSQIKEDELAFERHILHLKIADEV